MNSEAGSFDRRISIEIATETNDAAGDPIPSWALAFKLWCNRSDNRGREFFGASQMVRDSDTAFTVRASTETRAIAPETHRIRSDGKVFEIVAIAEGKARGDTLVILATSRPDLRGSKAPATVDPDA